MKPDVLTIAGSDPTGGAGIQSDLRTFGHFNVRGYSAVTALTAQNSHGVIGVWPAGAAVVGEQIRALLDDTIPGAVKIGMLCNGETVKEVCSCLGRLSDDIPVVLDPVLLSSSGHTLLDEEGVRILVEELIPRSTVITPNIPEARFLLGLDSEEDIPEEEICRRLAVLGARSSILKGGHGVGDLSVDYLYDGREISSFARVRVKGVEVHGSGCRFSSALAAFLARGLEMKEAVMEAKNFMDKVFREAVDRFL